MFKAMPLVCLAALIPLAGCASAPNGDATFFGQDIGASATAKLGIAQVDLQNFVASLPTACKQATTGVSFTQAQVAVANQVITTKTGKLTVGALNTIAADVAKVCAAEGLSGQ